MLRNLDMKNYSIFNVGRPALPTSVINKRYFNRNIYRPKFQIIEGGSFDRSLESDDSRPVHLVTPNTDHNIRLNNPLVEGNHFIRLFSDSFRLNYEENRVYMEINVTGLLKVQRYQSNDKIAVSIIQVKRLSLNSYLTRKLDKITLKPEFDCFNLL